MLDRRAFLTSLPALALAQPRPRPSVLVFLTDQETALPPGPLNVPNRRRLESGGVRFTNAFCTTPQCSAARSSLLTGLEPHKTGVITNVDGESTGKGLAATIPNLGSVFRAAGYQTGYFGKWHLGQEAQGRTEFGFTTTGRGKDEAVAQQAAAWIRQQTSPWLAYVSVLNPHDIYQIVKDLKSVTPRPGVTAPSSSLSDLASKPSEQQQYVDIDQGKLTAAFTSEDWLRYRTYYCQLIEKADACLGTVLDGITDLGTTVVAYSSDHGDALGEHGLPFKGPFMYEPLIRIPMVIRAPGRLKAEVREELVSSADLAPTLASLAGLSWPVKVAGLDLTRERDKRDAVFLEYYAKQKWVNPIRTIRTHRWKLNWYDSGHQELYDLKEDSREVRNLAGVASSHGIKTQLEARLNAWRGPLTKQ
jgi:arylsulfatase A-like enzyme